MKTLSRPSFLLLSFLLCACTRSQQTLQASLPASSPYDGIEAFQGSYAIARIGDAYGVIDSNGRIIVPIIHDGVYSFYPDFNWSGRERFHYESVFYVKDGDSLKVVNISRLRGERTDAEHIEAPYDYQLIKENGKYGYVNYLGETIPCQYENARDTFSQGLAAVVLNHRIGFIDKTGAVRIPFVFEYSEFDFNFYDSGLARFSEGLCAMTQNRKFGYIDKSGATVIPFEFDDAGPFHRGQAVVYKLFGKEKKAALIDAAGNILIPFQYDYIAIDEEEPVIHLMKGDSSYRAISPACR